MPEIRERASNALSPDNYRFLQTYIQSESGIALGEDKEYLLKARLQPVADALKLASLDELCKQLKGPAVTRIRQMVVEAMTTHETLFFRDPTVYDAIRTVLIPEILSRRQPGRPIRIWSAACSSGQEPYSLAMLLLEAGCTEGDVEIIATDLSNQILEKARSARYLQLEVNRGLPAALLVRYFRRDGLDWVVSDAVRRLVKFTPFDLRQNAQSLGMFDLVLCRNVLIYFELDTRKKIVSSIRGAMRPGACLLLGTSETVFQIDDRLQRRVVGASACYQLVP